MKTVSFAALVIVIVYMLVKQDMVTHERYKAVRRSENGKVKELGKKLGEL